LPVVSRGQDHLHVVGVCETPKGGVPEGTRLGPVVVALLGRRTEEKPREIRIGRLGEWVRLDALEVDVRERDVLLDAAIGEKTVCRKAACLEQLIRDDVRVEEVGVGKSEGREVRVLVVAVDEGGDPQRPSREGGRTRGGHHEVGTTAPREQAPQVPHPSQRPCDLARLGRTEVPAYRHELDILLA
jgi:hypothetical protein